MNCVHQPAIHTRAHRARARLTNRCAAAGLLLAAVMGCESADRLIAPDLPHAAQVEVPLDPTFLRFSNDRVIADSVASFWAVKGQNREVLLRFQGDKPGKPGNHFLRFKVPNDALERRPDGTPFQQGDSVQITVRVDPGGRFIFHFSPVGLVFNPDKPGELQIWYDGAHQDLNADGVIDGADAGTELQLRIFRQEYPGGSWVPIGVIELDPATDQIGGDIDHFSGFALAS